MTKSQMDAFNKALRGTVKNNRLKFLYNKRTKRYDVVVPITVVLRNFKKFTDKVNKDLGIKKKTK